MIIFTEFDDDLFVKFKDIVYSEAGIKLSDLKKALLQARLSKRLRALGLNSYREYYRYLMDNYSEESIEFINAITTNKTEFFRESRHFDYMKESSLPEFEKRGKQELRIWSAGCSTGEEPYTIAIVLSEYFENRKKMHIKILATDIDTNVIERGVAGLYSLDQVKDIDLPLLKKYFLRGSGDNEGLFMAKDQLKRMIHFRRLNLLENDYPMRKKFDIIFCRNVIIYFDKATQKVLFDRLGNYLDEDGYLFIGHSENITGISNRFSLIGHTIYRKSIFAMSQAE